MVELESHHLESPLEKLSQARIINGYFLNYKMKNCCNKPHKNHLTDFLLVTIGKWYFQSGENGTHHLQKVIKLTFTVLGPDDTVYLLMLYTRNTQHHLGSVLAKGFDMDSITRKWSEQYRIWHILQNWPGLFKNERSWKIREINVIWYPDFRKDI